LQEWPADKAIGYVVEDSAAPTVENTRSIAFRGSSAGGGYSTARDLLKLDAALRRGEIGDTAVLGRITARSPTGRVVLANGGGQGANVEISRVGDYTIIVMANLDPPAATRVLNQIVTLIQSSAGTSTAPAAPASSDQRRSQRAAEVPLSSNTAPRSLAKGTAKSHTVARVNPGGNDEMMPNCAASRTSITRMPLSMTTSFVRHNVRFPSADMSSSPDRAVDQSGADPSPARTRESFLA
nr:hypothetical protein [Gemmatimonadaceae bacterium]